MGGVLVVLSGPRGAGKSTLAEALEKRHGALAIPSRRFLLEHLGGRSADRRALRRAGAELEGETRGRWLAERLRRTASLQAGRAPWLVVDAVHTLAQVEAIRQTFHERVVHVHLTAPEDVLAARHEARRAPGLESGALDAPEYLSAENRAARRFEQLTPETRRHIEEIERVAGAPVSLISTRFHSRGVIDRRAW